MEVFLLPRFLVGNVFSVSLGERQGNKGILLYLSHRDTRADAFGKERALAFWAMMTAPLASGQWSSQKPPWCAQAAGSLSSAPIPQGHSARPPCGCSCSPASVIYASAISGCHNSYNPPKHLLPQMLWWESPAASAIWILRALCVSAGTLTSMSFVASMMSGELGASPEGKVSSVMQSPQWWLPSYQALPMNIIGSFVPSSTIVYWIPGMCQTLCKAVGLSKGI